MCSVVHDVAGREDSPVHTLQRRTTSLLTSTFVVNLVIPATDGVYQLVLYYGIIAEKEDEPPSAAARLLKVRRLLCSNCILRSTSCQAPPRPYRRAC